MTRKNFIVKACSACLSATAVAMVGTSCSATRYLPGNLVKNGLTINKTDFMIAGRKQSRIRSFVVIRNDALQFPICLYRFSDHHYSAIWMRCTHQGTELQAIGDTLQCPAHGSEFNSIGLVTSGPADNNLRTFPVIVNGNEIFIDLRKQS
jgi:Rieske Fe-S protein